MTEIMTDSLGRWIKTDAQAHSGLLSHKKKLNAVILIFFIFVILRVKCVRVEDRSFREGRA